ncbi:S1C family serine protease [Tetragenococcus koreensis]|uniref:S1C family serine protease n=1 Tax=Tetragenococcus koreensis TaxID=290335 RepID=UPI001F375602|nr:S1C family serine protease [Tetragenococcus koreensis]MCF1585670.1 S1C family serine protease [Tetragenococcus koreensis]MCF1615304.1 S1C family serine protease [Tetragenococcus koreensis]MCF1620315.1 S1C family serine protease [Tetragenococcus koreensis]MCF1625083.1 S1C family serine protease [Tetragenococcus koreensis]MCF1629936.1 S1C family serine protease [Tetragenococcus koreensis]
MAKKDVTPRPKKSGWVKKFGIGLLGGVIGGLLVIGGFYYLSGGSVNPFQSNEATSTSGVTDDNDNVQVSNVKVDADSDTTDAVNKVQDAVVSVINLQNASPQGSEGFFDTEQQEDDSEEEPAGEGSGVIYKEDGDNTYIVTNNHVVEGQNGLEVLMSDGTRETAELVGTDAYTDLAVLQISSDNVDTVATFGDSDELKVGEPAIAIGSPLGSDYANSVTQGIISSLNRLVSSQSESGEDVNINAIQTDAAINPGNSGGPLINAGGQVVGINSSKIASSGQAGVSVEGMGFSIPSNDVTDIINELEQNGEITRPALGISMLDLNTISTEQREQVLKIPDSVENGVVVQNPGNNSPASDAGLEQYDVITKADDKEITNSTELRAALYKKSVGDNLKLTFYREGEEQSVNIKLSEDQSIIEQNNGNQ